MDEQSGAPIPASWSARRLVGGTFSYSLYFLICNNLLPFLITPYIVHKLGVETYGVWALVLTLAGWLVYIDLGLHLGVSRQVGRSGERGDIDGFARLFCTVAWIYLAVAAVFLAGGYFMLSSLLNRFVGVADPFAAQALYLMFVMQVVMVGYRLLNHVEAGLQRISESSRTSGVIGIAQAALAVLAVALDLGMRGLAAAYALSSLAFLGAFLLRVRRAPVGPHGFPMTLRFSSFDRALARDLFSYGSVLYISQVLYYVLLNDRLYLGYVRAPLELVAAYHLGSAMIGKGAALMHSLSLSLYPASAALASRDDRARLAELACRGFKMHVLAGTSLFVFAAMFADWFFILWMGEPVPAGVAVARLLCLWGWSTVFFGLYSVGSGMGRPGLQLASAVFAVALAAACFIPMFRRFGFEGLAATISLASVCGGLLYVRNFLKHILPVSPRLIVWENGLKAMTPALLAAALAAALRLAASPFNIEGRAVAALWLAGFFAVYAAAALLSARALKLIDDKESGIILGFFRPRAEGINGSDSDTETRRRPG